MTTTDCTFSTNDAWLRGRHHRPLEVSRPPTACSTAITCLSSGDATCSSAGVGRYRLHVRRQLRGQLEGTVTNDTYNNYIYAVGSNVSGGAISSSALVTTTDCTFSANYASGYISVTSNDFWGDEAVVHASGGAIYSSAPLVASSCTFSGNYVSAQGNAYETDSSAGTDAEIHAVGGAISSGGVTITNCTLSANYVQTNSHADDAASLPAPAAPS